MDKKAGFVKKISFGTLAAVIVCIAVATFIEKYKGSEYVNTYIYSSYWFILLWLILCIAATGWIIHRKIYRKKTSFCIHCAFLIILTGALLTSLTGKKGYIHLRAGEVAQSYIEEKTWNAVSLPFTLSLDSFKTEYYPGTNAPSDYISYIKIQDEDTLSFRISMNKILSRKGYRLYQSSFDEDLSGTVLAVNFDRWGIPVTYTGYICLGLSMIFLLFSKEGKFQRLIKNPLLKGGFFIFFLFFSSSLFATSSMNTENAEELGEVLILYNSRVVPIQTFARDFTLKLTGKPFYKEFSAEQVLAGWMFYPQEWQHEPLIRIKNKQLQKMLGVSEFAPLTAFFSDKKEYLLASFWSELHQGDKKTSLIKAIEEADEKIQLILMLEKGVLLKIFPSENNGNFHWFSPTEQLPEYVAENDKLLIQNIFTLLYEAVLKKDNVQTTQIIHKLKNYQLQKGKLFIPDKHKIQAELWYNKMNLTTLLYRVNLALGLLSLFYFLIIFLRQKQNEPETTAKTSLQKTIFPYIFNILLFLSFGYLTIGIILRTYISGRIPLGNGYETMLFVSWCILLIGVIGQRKFPLAVSFSFLLSGFTLLVSSLGQMNPQITPLMPVLLSPWLSIHVSLIMISYALFAFILFNSVISLFFLALKREGKQEQKLQVVNKILLYPAVFLLGAGIFVGAVWANVSWGRYWAWDPKEVWALITFLVYGIGFHSESISWLRKPLFFHIYMILAFGTVLMTYLGVNLFLGGIHSYN